MKALNKQAIETRYEKSNYKPTVELYSLLKERSYISYNKMLKIVIPGEPLRDGRTRHGKFSNTVFNVDKPNLMKVFERVYRGSILEKLCIIGPMKVHMRIYRPVVKKYIKLMGPDNRELLKKELMPSFVTPDNDNYEKIHYDVLQDDVFKVILRDEEIVSNPTEKFFVEDKANARCEIYIYFNDTVEDWYWVNSVLPSAEYFKFTISPKYFRIKGIPEEKWKETFYKTMLEWRQTYKKDLMESVRSLVKSFSANDLRIIGEGRNKDESINNILKNTERIQKKT